MNSINSLILAIRSMGKINLAKQIVAYAAPSSSTFRLSQSPREPAIPPGPMAFPAFRTGHLADIGNSQTHIEPDFTDWRGQEALAMSRHHQPDQNNPKLPRLPIPIEQVNRMSLS
jgi:hypothetical protein